MNKLKHYFETNNKRLIHKWDHYFDIYDTHFRRFQNQRVNILEIGVFKGGSLQMWKNYFGENANIYGLDIDPNCKSFEEENIKIFIGSQADRNFLNKLKQDIPPLDIIVDDGSHIMAHQIISFQELYPRLKDRGIYVCEDVQTSYDYRYGGGVKRKGTFIEHSKRMIDSLNAYNSEQSLLKVNEFTKTTNSIHFYDGVVVFEKKVRDKPNSLVSNDGQVLLNVDFSRKSVKKLKSKILKNIQKLVQGLRIPAWWIK